RRILPLRLHCWCEIEGLQDRFSVRILARELEDTLLRLPQLTVTPLQETDPGFVFGERLLKRCVAGFKDAKNLFQFRQCVFEGRAFVWVGWRRGHGIFRDTGSSVTVRLGFGRLDTARNSAVLQHGLKAVAGLNLSGGTEERW